MFEIQTLNKISPAGLDVLDNTKYKCADEFANPDGIILRSFSMHEMELPENLKAVARAGAGTNNIPIDKCSEKGIVVFNTPGANANAVKELVLAGLLLSSRKIVPAIEWINTLKGEGDAVPKLVEKGKSKFVGPEIKGKTLGVIGLGAIGVMVANAAHSLGMDVLGYDPYISVDAAWGLSRAVVHAQNLKDIFENADYITVHVPLNAETKEMINSESINTMKSGVRILNFARGELVATDDMINALEDGKVACYVTDFANDKLLGVKGVVPMPHLGASTPESEDNCAFMAAKELVAYLEEGNIVNSVNFPSVESPRTTDARVCVIHKNIPAMITKITSVFKNNIDNMVNKSRKDVAYTILDIDGDGPANEEIEALSAMEGVIRVRVIK